MAALTAPSAGNQEYKRVLSLLDFGPRHLIPGRKPRDDFKRRERRSPSLSSFASNNEHREGIATVGFPRDRTNIVSPSTDWINRFELSVLFVGRRSTRGFRPTNTDGSPTLRILSHVWREIRIASNRTRRLPILDCLQRLEFELADLDTDGSRIGSCQNILSFR